MGRHAREIQAVFFILLLVGHDAARLKLRADMDAFKSDETSPSVSKAIEAPADQRFAALNKAHCKWRTLRGGCTGEGCRFRPLPGDRRLTDGCRLADSYMFATPERAESFMELQSEMLSEKSAKFSRFCVTRTTRQRLFSRTSIRCVRRAGHMIQASEYLLKVQSHVAELGVNHSINAEIAPRLDKAYNDVAGALGPDGVHLLELKRKTQATAGDFMKTPRRSVKELLSIITDLNSDSTSLKQIAREKIAKMPDRPNGDPEQNRAEAQKALEEDFVAEGSNETE